MARCLLAIASLQAAALRTLAKLHAHFWQGARFWAGSNREAADELQAGVWPAGGYWQPSMQPADQCANLDELNTKHIT